MGRPKPASPWYANPIWLGALGLALMVGGYKVATHLPLTPREREQAERLAEVRELADAEFRERLDRVEGNVRRDPPLRWPGRLVMLAGAALFVTAGVRMARQPSVVPEDGPEAPEGSRQDSAKLP